MYWRQGITVLLYLTLDAMGMPLGDSIYSMFVLQEAIRLFDTTDRVIQSGQEKALFIYAPVSTLHYPSNETCTR
jgi:hypothetical protein